MSASASSSQWQRRLHPWELREYEEPAGDIAGDDVGSGDEGEETDLEDLSPEASSIEFFNFVVSLKLKGEISARAACVLSYWAKRGGLAGQGAKLAMHPNRSGGSFSDHFDKVVGIAEHMGSYFLSS